MEQDSPDDRFQEDQNGQASSDTSDLIELRNLNNEGENNMNTSDDIEIHDSLSHRRNSSYEDNLIKTSKSQNVVPEIINEEFEMYHNQQPNIERVIYQDEVNSLLKAISAVNLISLERILDSISESFDLTQVLNQENGYTLLHLAVFKDSEKIISML